MRDAAAGAGHADARELKHGGMKSYSNFEKNVW